MTYLDAENIRAVIAHELMHDWTATHFPEMTDPYIIEGLSEYAAWKVCQIYGYTRMMQRLEQNEAPVYSQGFQRVRQADRGRGMRDIMEWLTSRPRP